VPWYISPFALSLALGLILLRWTRPGWLQWALPISLYLLVPFLVYFSATEKAGWVGPIAERAQSIAYIGLTLSIVLVLKFTRRRKGFRGTPLDFLILFLIAFLVPQLPFEILDGQQLRFFSAKLLILFFAVEVLMGELRGKLDRFGAAALLALIIAAVRGAIPG
jgi:UDP-GlcNAc:undecaprenyl-phosphate GlcNAc-1-phosphate transferase